MRRSILASLLLPVMCISTLSAQNSYNLAQFGNETIEFIKQPTRWEGND